MVFFLHVFVALFFRYTVRIIPLPLDTQKNSKCNHDWVGKVIHWDLCKRLKCDHAQKWYIYKLESFIENGTQEILRDFQIQADFQSLPVGWIQNLSRRNKTYLVKKRNDIHISGSYQRADKAVEQEDDTDTSCTRCLWNVF